MILTVLDGGRRSMYRETKGHKLKRIDKEMSQLIQHKMSGFFRPSTDLDLYYDFMDIQIRIQYFLEKEVIEFIEKLPVWIRNIKTIVIKDPEIVYGRISGSIDWQMTIKKRMMENPLDPTLFVINRIERNFNIPQNLVLKKLLSVLYTIILDDIPMAFDHSIKYPNLKSMVAQKQIREILNEVYLKNIYMRRISLEECEKINERMINDTLKARTPLYRNAAKLLKKYRELMN